SVGQLGALLCQFPEHDARPDPEPAGRELHPPEQHFDEGRLTAAVAADDRQPVCPAELEVDRPEGERAALDDRLLEPQDDVTAPLPHGQRDPQVPGLVRLLDPFEALDPACEPLLHVLLTLLLASLPVAALFP